MSQIRRGQVFAWGMPSITFALIAGHALACVMVRTPRPLFNDADFRRVRRTHRPTQRSRKRAPPDSDIRYVIGAL